MTTLNITQTETIIGFHFNNPQLLVTALTHRSYTNEQKRHRNQKKQLKQSPPEHNERLEFLGDAVIDFIIGAWLYERFPAMREGQLTRLRAALVRTEQLAEFARQIRLNDLLRLGRGDEKNGGRHHNRILCGAFEALCGAIYMDQGTEALSQYVQQFFDPALVIILERVSTKDPKTRLQEYTQQHPDKITPTYQTITALGADHQKQFVVEVSIREQAIGWGNGRSKRQAEQHAATQALGIIEEILPLTPQPEEKPKRKRRRRRRRRRRSPKQTA